jgi:hypothetical protein
MDKNTLVIIVCSSVLATALVFAIGYTIQLVEDLRYRRRKAREAKMAKDAEQDERLYAIERNRR